MASWAEFEAASPPELATFGAHRLNDRVAYLATVREDGSPRVHPVSARIREGRLFVRMDRTSPKSKDLLRDPRYTLHSLVTDSSGTGGEFVVSGRAALIDDAALIAALEEGMENPGQYLLFELSPEEAMSTVYQCDAPVRHRWAEGQP